MLIPYPQPGEYPPYAIMYMKLISDDGQLLKHLKDNFEMVKKLVYSLPEEKLLHRYAPGKWSIKEVLVHIIDDERIYAYRAMCFARNEKTPLPGFEQEDYIRYSNANERTLDNIMAEYEAVRNATITMYEGFDETALMRRGVANENEATVRALGYHMAGHEMHHINIIKEKYLS